METRVLNFKELCVALNLSAPSVLKIIKTDETFPIIKLNNKYSMSVTALDDWLKKKSEIKLNDNNHIDK